MPRLARPLQICALDALEHLDVQSNQLTSVPRAVATMPALTQLHLAHNPLLFPPAGVLSQGSAAVLDYIRHHRQSDLQTSEGERSAAQVAAYRDRLSSSLGVHEEMLRQQGQATGARGRGAAGNGAAQGSTGGASSASGGQSGSRGDLGGDQGGGGSSRRRGRRREAETPPGWLQPLSDDESGLPTLMPPSGGEIGEIDEGAVADAAEDRAPSAAPAAARAVSPAPASASLHPLPPKRTSFFD